jgi:SAM-dependent methyltransferase
MKTRHFPARDSLARIIQIVSMNGGGNPLTFARAIRGLPAFLRDAAAYRRAESTLGFPLRLGSLFPILGDRYEEAGALGHYFHQDLWAARKIFAKRPKSHVDIGSRIDGFVAHLLAFMPVTVVDVRPLTSEVQGLSFVQEDAAALRTFADESIESLSSLHAVEHFGLGRYGDPVDPSAPSRMMRTLSRVLKPGGRLYFSVPVGRERLEFNAHRVFAPRSVMEAFPALQLVSFAAISDEGELLDPCGLDQVALADYACGLFEFEKS